MLVHSFTMVSDDADFPIVLEDYTATEQYAKDLGTLWIDTVSNIGSY